MTNQHTLLTLLTLSLSFMACQPEGNLTDAPQTSGTGSAVIKPMPDIADVTVEASELMLNPSSRSVYTGTTLQEDNRTYGIIICQHLPTTSGQSPALSDYVPYDLQKLYGNIQAWWGSYNNKSRRWWYSFENSSSSRFDPLYLVTDDKSRHFDLFAYSPWRSGITIESGYTYNLASVAQSNLPDIMYATYEGTDGTTPTNIDKAFPNDDNPIPINIHFHHVLARIVFHFRLANPQNIGYDESNQANLYQIGLQRNKNATTELYTRGKMNLLTGEVTKEQVYSQSEQYVNYGNSGIGTAWKEYSMLVHPTPYMADGDFSFRFWFNSANDKEELIHTYDIKRSDLLHPDGTTYGFQPGYVYHFYYILDNYIHLQNVVIDTDWTDTPEEEIKI